MKDTRSIIKALYLVFFFGFSLSTVEESGSLWLWKPFRGQVQDPRVTEAEMAELTGLEGGMSRLKTLVFC